MPTSLDRYFRKHLLIQYYQYFNNIKYFILLKLGVFCETEVTPTTTTTSSISSATQAEFCPIGIINKILNNHDYTTSQVITSVNSVQSFTPL